MADRPCGDAGVAARRTHLQQRRNPRWPAAPPWHETREEFEARVAEYDRREAVLARHSLHVVYREANTSFRVRTNGRPGVLAADRRAAYVCDETGVPVSFGQASHAIEYAWEHLLPPLGKQSEDRRVRGERQPADPRGDRPPRRAGHDG
jgi:hypothetical protein